MSAFEGGLDKAADAAYAAYAALAASPAGKRAINATRQISVVPGATAELSFRGVGVDLYAATMAAGGTMQIALDGVDTDTVDLSGDTEGRVVVFSDHELSDGWHTLEVTLLDGLGVVDSAVVWRLDYREGGEQADTGPFGSEQETDPPIDDTGDTDNADDTGDTGNGSGRCPGYGCTAGGAVRDLALVCFALGLVAWRRRSRGMLRPR